MRLLDVVANRTTQYMEEMPKELRKEQGQFFTSAETAAFMAELVSPPSGKQRLRVLDPGAGSGILAAALLERLDTYTELQKIELVCYETDEHILPLLWENLRFLCDHLRCEASFEIRAENYITSQSAEYNGLLWSSGKSEGFDLIIGNPPYKKIAKNAPEALAMPDVCYGAPNLYFLFAAMSAFNLQDEGEMVYIIPRSWTSGAYFTRFRQKFLHTCALLHIHLFVSRDKVFEQENVLQETMIVKARKTPLRGEAVTITASRSSHDFSERSSLSVPYDIVVSGPECYVFLVTSAEEAETLTDLRSWKDTLPKIGLPMKTGLTVDFRNQNALRSSPEEAAVPLFYAQHIQNGKVIFPIGKKNEFLVTDQQGLLQANGNYLFVKRFTAKEERRRLQCGVYLSRIYPDYRQISTQNKLNFIGGRADISECVIYGLYVLFNSTLYDRYYRILNGSTQVNSTEINSMPVPPVEIIEKMGKALIQSRDSSEQSCNTILRSYLHEKVRASETTASGNAGPH